jgi:hypothetical protein
LSGIVRLVVGESHTLALREDGSMWGWRWGYYDARALGDSPPATGAKAAALEFGIGKVVEVAAGRDISALVRSDGLVFLAGTNDQGRLGDGTYAEPERAVGVVDGAYAGFLDLSPAMTKLAIPKEKKPPFFMASYKAGVPTATKFKADVRGSDVETSGPPASGNSKAPVQNVYVAARVPGGGPEWFLLDSNRSWNVLQWPMKEHKSKVELGRAVDIVGLEILNGEDISGLEGSSIFVGYGVDADDMLAKGRYREVMKIGPKK